MNDSAPMSPTDWWTAPDHAGHNYVHCLARLHAELQPQTYLEIGTLYGSTLNLASCSSIAIDPGFQITSNVIGTKPSCLFFQKGSDAFFAEHDPKILLGQPIDLAFLDGRHLYEFLVRDFLNVEKSCRRNSVIAMHDCVPTDEYIARRIPDTTAFREQTVHPEWWAGDVWKAASILRRFRPDLRIRAFDAGPTGLVVITNLDPGNQTIQDNYFSIVEEYQNLTLASVGFQNYAREIDLQSTSVFDRTEDILGMFWR